MDDPIVELLVDEWKRIVEVCRPLTEEQWKLASPCPGWTVQDVLAHMVGTESALAGAPVPDAPPEVYEAAHVKNAIGRDAEKWIHSMRPLPGAAVLERFVAVTATRASQLHAKSDADFETVGWSPIGDVPYRVFMDVRLMDCWVHEQDIRATISVPGHRRGAIVERAMARFVAAMPMTVAKKAAAPDGSVVVFDLTGDSSRRVIIAVEGGRARVVESHDSPTVTITTETPTWWWMALGRVDPREVRARGGVTITGETALGERVVDALAFMI